MNEGNISTIHVYFTLKLNNIIHYDLQIAISASLIKKPHNSWGIENNTQEGLHSIAENTCSRLNVA